MDVLLIQPPVSFNAKIEDIIPDCPHLGLLYLASSLENHGITVNIIDNIDGSISLSHFVNIIKREHPKVIGITAMTMNIRGAVQLAKHLKDNISGDIQICLGGPHMSADPTVIERFPYFDFGIIGEGEITFINIVKEIIFSNKQFSGVLQGEVPIDLDVIPFPSRHLVDFEVYKKRGYWANAILATRGCPYHCIFCSIPAISKKVRFRSPANIIAEMEECYKLTRNKTFVFIDDALTIKESFVYALCDEMKTLSFKPKWVAQTRADYMNEKLLKEMKDSGCYELIFGVETGSERIRNEIIKKKITNKDIEEATMLCKMIGIEPDWYLMMGHPTETKKELEETINYPIGLGIKPNIIGVHITMPLPGSPLFELAIQDGIIEIDVIDKYIDGVYGETYKNSWPYYIPKGLTYSDLLNAQKLAYKKFYFRLDYIIKKVKSDIFSLDRLKKDAVQGASLLLKGRATDDKTK